VSSDGAASRLEVRFERGAFRLEVSLAWDERVAVIFGASGSGKSTLMEIVLGLHPRARGIVRLGGTWLEDASRGLRLAPEQRGLGWVPQDPMLFPHLPVRRNLDFGLRRGDAEAGARLDRAVEVLELGPLLDRPVADLSGGERQRVAIGRAIAAARRALLMDEPLASLDLPLRARILRYLLRIRDELSLPMLYITHDPDEALLVGERVVVLDGGREVASGTPRAVLWSRAVLPVSQALGIENVFEGRVVASGEAQATLQTAGGLQLVLPVELPVGEAVSVGLRAEDVLLALEVPGEVSARNVWQARVAACEREAERARIHLEVGPGCEPLVALLTPGAAARLTLRAGSRVHALVKAQAIRRLA
jgi:molybdate transport system ATP-binding protein